MNQLLQTIFGSESSAGVLSFLVAYRQGYPSEIARFIGMDLFAVQKQLKKFEAQGLLHSRIAGRARIYSFDPKHPLHTELISLIEKAVDFQMQVQKPASITPLPETQASFFWDFPFKKLTWEADRELVIRRLLTDGSWEAVTWLRRQIGDIALRKWLIMHRGRGLSPRQLRFWSLALALPDRQVRAWAHTARFEPWSKR